MDMSTISLCMIVRDEKDSLGRCLESACGFVNEIIIVDTGSRDSTPAIAKHYGARVCYLPWQDDFSQARNESLKQAIGEWVLILDADEELPPETAYSLRRLASCRDVEAWTFSIISPGPSNEAGQQIRHPGLRLFKNREAYFFEGRIHEQIRPSILRADPTAAIRHADAEIVHYGYRQHAGQRREKTLRNISIIQQALAERPGDPFLGYNLGLSFYALGDLEKSRRHYAAVRQRLDPGDLFTAAFFRNYAICLGDLGDFEQALHLIDEGLAYFPDYPDLYFIKGELLFDLNMMAQAKESFLKCLRFHTRPEYVTTEGVTGHLALQNLAEICTRQQDLAAAVAYLEQALRIRPADKLFAQLCSLMKQKGLAEGEVATYLETSFHLDHAAIARLLFDIKEAGYSREDLRQLEDSLHGGIATAGVYYLLGTACGNLDRHDQAFVYLAQAGLQEPGNELYAACALEQLASQCLLHITRMLDLESGPEELRKEMFRLTSLRRKTQRLKQDLLKSDARGKKPQGEAK
jgi:glycosyltransferase involved in cell wall biosynthesis